jgi:hypothetical protein
LTDRLVDRSLLCGCVRLHSRSTITDAPRLQPNELHCAHHASEHNFGDTEPRSASHLARSTAVRRPGPVDALRFPPERFARCATGHLGKTVVEPSRPGVFH